MIMLFNYPVKSESHQGSLIKSGVNPNSYHITFHFEAERYFKRMLF